MSMRWYVVNTLPHQEERAELNLRRQGYRPWLPRVLRSRRHAQRFDQVRTALFPGYLFLPLDLEHQRWRPVMGTFGVRQIICFNERPAPVPEGFVEALQGCADDQGMVSAPQDQMRPGAFVRVLRGPFVDHVGTLVGLDHHRRVSLLLNVLGREVATSVSVSAVAPAA